MCNFNQFSLLGRKGDRIEKFGLGFNSQIAKDTRTWIKLNKKVLSQDVKKESPPVQIPCRILPLRCC